MPRRGKRKLTVIVNPNAGRLSDEVRKDVVSELRARFDVDAYSTTGRDTGIGLAGKLARSGAEVVVAFGGDGHVNEVANGLAGTDATLAIVPGGTMNVFARALGVPLDPTEAIDYLEQRLDRTPRRVPLGKMNERYFTFSAGCGFDAEAAERVERYVPAKRRFGEVFFYWSAVRVLTGSFRRREPTLTLEGPWGTVKVAMAIASNAGPYAYFMGRPVNIAPQVRLEGGVDVFALKTMRLEALPVYAWRVAVTGDIADHPDTFYSSDLQSFEISAPEPFSRHVDGEPLHRVRRARFSVEPDVLKVLGT